MGKPTICIGENKDADQLRGVTAKLNSAFVFATRIVQFLFYLNPKFQFSSSFLCLYSPVCVGAVQKPHCWFSHETAHYRPSATPRQLTLATEISAKPSEKQISMYFRRKYANQPVLSLCLICMLVSHCRYEMIP